MPFRIGVDTGGTFTDVVVHDTASGGVQSLKVPSTPADPGAAILAGIEAAAERGFVSLDEVTAIVHGTTVATNALLQRSGARTALVTTRGFRDVLEIGRQNRPEMYNLRSRRPPPLVPRELRLEVTERVLADGAVESPLDEDELCRLIDNLTHQDVEAIVVGLLHSHVNPAHELQVGRVLAERAPGVAVCLSHQIACEPGEFERFSTAAANGYVQPVVEGYLERLTAGLLSIGVRAPVMVMKSSGGAGSAKSVAKRCVETALSGPAGGVRACVGLAEKVPGGNLIAADMGGTSFDVAVVTGSKPELAREATIAGLPLRVPMLDIHTIGAGGGSIAWVDAGGALRVGPHSAGAQPGPACYGRGGTLPTVTDANLVLGRLATESRLAGGMQLDLTAARGAIDEHVAGPLGMAIEDAAQGIVKIANVAMTAALKKLTVERGVDPREYTLCPFGGAGPLHGAELAAELGAARVIVPQVPGVFSAIGLLRSQLREDRFASCKEPLTERSVETIHRLTARLIDEAQRELSSTSDVGEAAPTRHAAALRYRGQTSDLQVEWPLGSAPDPQSLEAGFHRAHRQRFGFDRRGHPIELAGVAVSVESPAAEHAGFQGAALEKPIVPAATRQVWFAGRPLETSIVDRVSLEIGETVGGPAVIEQDDTTTIVPPGWEARVEPTGELMLTPLPGGTPS